MSRLEPPTLAQTMAFQVHKWDFVQILNVRNCHWCTISSDEGVVNVYDSMYSTVSYCQSHICDRIWQKDQFRAFSEISFIKSWNNSSYGLELWHDNSHIILLNSQGIVSHPLSLCAGWVRASIMFKNRHFMPLMAHCSGQESCQSFLRKVEGLNCLQNK